MDVWAIWLAIGIFFMIIEIITPGFYFFSFGVGAIVTGLTARIFPGLPTQLIIFSLSTTISFLLMKRFASFLLKPNATISSNVDALIGKIGTVTKSIQTDKKGYVKVESEEWSAISANSGESIEEGEQVKVLRLEGNKVIVEKHSKET
ncbi:MAG: NfeD family protein [Candidatus Cloacimonetes bacterium]|nr:NfeD family protein [Candidatus Cloacimonadota bacterium]